MIFIKKKEWIFLLLILIAGFVVRLYRFNNPIADWHSWRQADTSAVSRNFIKYGFDVLHPKYDDISNVQTGYDNPKGYRFVEFPIYNVFQAFLFKLLGKLTLEEWGRLVTILATALSTIFIYLLTSRHLNTRAGIFAAGFYAFVPYSIYYGRTILPDPSMVTAILGGIYFFDKWIEAKNKNKPYVLLYYLLSLFFTASSFLLKPYALFFVLPIVWLAWSNWKYRMFLKPLLWLYVFLSILPIVFWRIWMQQYPEGIPSSAWLFNGGNIRFTGAFFYWIFFKRIGELILGVWGLPVVIFGFLKSNKKLGIFIASFLSSLIYVFVMARGNVQHDYYQILIIPSIAFLFGIGGDYLFSEKKLLGLVVFCVCTLFTLSFGWYQVRDYFNINNPSIILAGKAVDSLTPKNAKIVAPYNGDTSLLYQSNRKGWPSFEKPLNELIDMGANYLVLVNPKPQDYNIGKTYKIVSATSDYIIFNLNKKR